MRAIQYIDSAPDSASAHAMLDSLAIQVDYLAGRVLAPSPSKPGWRVQALFEDVPEVAPELLPEGCRHVFVPRGFMGLNG